MIEFKTVYSYVTEMSAKRAGATLSSDDQGKLYELSLARSINNHEEVGRGDKLPRHHRSYSDNPDHAGTPGQVYDRLVKKAGKNSSEVSLIRKQARETASKVIESLKDSGHLGRTETNGVKHPPTKVTNVFWTSNRDTEKKAGDHELTSGIKDTKSKGDVMLTIAPQHPAGFHKENHPHYKSGHDQGVIALVEKRRAEANGEKYTPPENPHPKGSKAHKVWSEGFSHGQLATHVNISAKYASKAITFENAGIESIGRKLGSKDLAKKLKDESNAHDERMATQFGYSGKSHGEIHEKKFKPERKVYEQELKDHVKKTGTESGFKPKSKQAKKVYAAYAAANDSYKTAIGHVRKTMLGMNHKQLRNFITDSASPETHHTTLVAHSNPETGENQVHSKSSYDDYVDQYRNLRVESKQTESGPTIQIVGDHPEYGKGVTVAQMGHRISHGITGARVFDFKMPGFGKKRRKKEQLKEMILEAKQRKMSRDMMLRAEKAAEAAERMQLPMVAAGTQKQKKQARENSNVESQNKHYGRKIQSKNMANASLQRQAELQKSVTQTSWRDAGGVAHVGGADYAVLTGKAANLADKGIGYDKQNVQTVQQQALDDTDKAILTGAQLAAQKQLEKIQKNSGVNEEAPANAMGTAGISGASTAVNAGIAGYDVPIGMVRRKPPKMFAGKAVFTVPSSDFYNATLGKKKGKHYRSYVSGDLGEEVRQFALQNKNSPIILEDETTGAMMYLKYGKEK